MLYTRQRTYCQARCAAFGQQDGRQALIPYLPSMLQLYCWQYNILTSYDCAALRKKGLRVSQVFWWLGPNHLPTLSPVPASHSADPYPGSALPFTFSTTTTRALLVCLNLPLFIPIFMFSPFPIRNGARTCATQLKVHSGSIGCMHVHVDTRSCVRKQQRFQSENACNYMHTNSPGTNTFSLCARDGSQPVRLQTMSLKRQQRRQLGWETHL